ncbi:hypothetical protein M8494_08085 [Serratia ureilytica]
MLSRLKEPENSSISLKMRVYDGKSHAEYRSSQVLSGVPRLRRVDEGMNGLPPRFAFKILSRVFNFDHAEVVAKSAPHLFYVLEQQIEREQFRRTAEKPERRLSDPEIRNYRPRSNRCLDLAPEYGAEHF